MGEGGTCWALSAVREGALDCAAGGVTWDAAQAGGPPVPGLHSPNWAPDAEAVVATASEALATLAMEILKPAG